MKKVILHLLLLNLGLPFNYFRELDYLPGQSLQRAYVSIAKNLPRPHYELPPNHVRPGGSLDNIHQSCRAASKSLTALIPVQNPVLTISAYPTLLFFVPDNRADVGLGAFSILKQDGKTYVYNTHFILPQVPGIISISLPELSEYALEEGKSYHWYFKLYCQRAADPKTNLNVHRWIQVDGWIQRIASTPERQQLVQSTAPDIWYDALAGLAHDLQSKPGDPKLQERWSHLLQSIGMENLTTQPFIGSVWKLKIRL
jgi:hypothetical protein